MSIIRTKGYTPSVIVSIELINDKDLQCVDLGLLVYMLSKPDDWILRVEDLAREMRLSSATVYAILKRLRELGYVEVIKHSTGKTDWHIYDKKQDWAIS